jgi:hypothetical protein
MEPGSQQQADIKRTAVAGGLDQPLGDLLVSPWRSFEPIGDLAKNARIQG